MSKLHSIVGALALLVSLAAPLHSETAQAAYDRGMKFAHAQEFDRAIYLMRKALAREPRNNDMRLGLARVLGWAREYSEAHHLVNEVLNGDPDNTEARLLKARLYYYEGALDQAAETLRSLSGSIAVDGLRSQIESARKAADRTGWSVSLSYENSGFANISRSSWSSVGMELRYRLNDRVGLSIGRSQANRFDMANDLTTFGISLRPSDTVSVGLTYGLSNNATFLPSHQLDVSAEWQFWQRNMHRTDAWATLDLQFRNYPSGDQTFAVNPGLRVALSKDVISHARWINSFDAHGRRLQGWSLQTRWQTPLDGLNVTFGLSQTGEMENGAVVRVSNWSIGPSFRLNESTSIYVGYSNENRNGSYLRETISTAIVMRL